MEETVTKRDRPMKLWKDHQVKDGQSRLKHTQEKKNHDNNTEAVHWLYFMNALKQMFKQFSETVQKTPACSTGLQWQWPIAM